MPKPIFRTRLRLLRQGLGLTQVELSNIVPCTPAYISKLETGTKIPSGTMLIKLSEALQCSMDYLLGKVNESGKQEFETIPYTEETHPQEEKEAWQNQSSRPSPWEPENKNDNS